MERLPSLINSLKNGFEEGRSVTELLNLLDEMRNELTRSIPASDHTQSPVSIWLPAGYQKRSQSTISPISETISPVSATMVEETPFIADFIKDSLNIQSGPEAKKQTEVEKPNVAISNPVLATGVPRPPQVTILEEMDDVPDPEEVLPQQGSLFPEDDDFKLPGNYHVHSNGIFRENLQGNRVMENEFNTAGPIVVELELPDETAHRVEDETREHSMTITENFLKSKTSAVAEGRPAELHEILANRVVAQPAVADMPKQGKILADTLAGGKIHDLRKGIAINDRFRYINSLFRGDETLFERSVKTINNFNILQEAQYWMQRELVIKLGWNEEDELVQMFYQLVSRRFS